MEALEQRFLLSADLLPLSIDMVADGDDLTLRFDSLSAQLQILDNANAGVVVAAQPLAETSGVVVAGTGEQDRLTLDLEAPFGLPDGVWFDGVLGDDSLILTGGSFVSVAYGLDGAGSGMLALDDGAGSLLIHFGAVESVTDLIDASNRSFEDVSGRDTLLRLGDDDAGATGVSRLEGDQVLVAFANPTGTLSVGGGAGDDTLALGVLDAGLNAAVRLDGGAGSDTLLGPDLATSWIIDGVDAGTVGSVAFEGVENLRGGAGDDTFVFAGGSITGLVDGGEGSNSLDYSGGTASVTVDLASQSASDTGGFANVHHVAGSAGEDTVIGPATGALWQLTGASSGAVGSFGFVGIENIAAGDGDDTFELAAGASLSGALAGGDGSDAILAGADDDVFAITGSDSGTAAGIAFMDIETLLGGAGNDEFLLAVGGFLSGGLGGGMGIDRVRGAGQTNVWRVSGGGQGSLNGQGFDSIERLDGGDGDDTLEGPAANSTWTVDGAGAGNVGGYAFAGMENLTGAADNQDTFVFEDGGALAGLVHGGAAGFDTLVVGFTGVQSLAYAATGPHSGSVTADGNVIAFDGLEPVTLAGTDDLVITATSGADDLILEADPVNAGMLRLFNAGTATIEEANIAVPLNSLTLNLGDGADKLTIGDVGAFDLNKLTINGDDATDDGLDDTVSISRDGELSLSDVSLGVGSSAIALSGIEIAELSGGAGADTFTVSGWNGAATLAGAGGDDTYVLGEKFGDVSIAASDAGTDTLDFTGNSDAVILNPTDPADRSAITAGTDSVTQLGDLAEILDESLVDLTPLNDLFDDLLSFVEDVQTAGGAVAALSNQLPVVADADGSLADVVGLTQAFETFATEAQAAINSANSIGAVASALDGLDLTAFTGGLFDSLTVSATPDYRGEDPDVAGGVDGRLELLLDIAIDGTIADRNFSLGLGEAVETLGLSLDATVSIDASLDADFIVGLSTDATPEAFLVPGGTFALTIEEARADFSSTPVNLGFLELTLDSGFVSLDGTGTLTLQDPNSDGDDRVSFSDILGDIGGATSFGFSDPDPGDGFLDASAAVSLAAGVDVGGLGDLATGTIDFGLSLSGNPFGDDTGLAEPELSLTADVGGTTVDLLNFGNLGPNDMLAFLGSVLDSLVSLASQDALQTNIPFTDKSLGDVLDFGQSFKEEVLDPLFVSGDILAPDSDSDGDVDGDDLTFSSVQGLVAELANNLGIPNLTSVYNEAENELLFTIDFDRAFGLGAGDVTTLQQGDGTNPEIQQLTFDAATTESFRLALRDSLGELMVTAPIDGTLADASGDISAELTALGLTLTSVARVGDGVYTIEFDPAEGDLPQLGFAGELALDFGTNLGVDFADISTSGSFGLAAILDTGLTFGLDLSASSAVQVLPELAQPDNSASATVSRADGAGDDSVQVLRLDNATGGDIALSLGIGSPTETTAKIDFDASGGTLQTRINTDLATDLGGASVTSVSVSTDGNDRIYTITFDADPGALLAVNTSPADGDALGGVAENGILSGDIRFDLALINNAIALQEYDDSGDPVGSGDELAENAVGSVTVSVARSETTGNTGLSDLAEVVQAKVNAQLAAGGLTLGFFDAASGGLGTGTVADGANKIATYVPFTGGFPSDIQFTVAIGGDEFSGRLRAVDVLDAGDGSLFDGAGNLTGEAGASVTVAKLATELQAAIAAAIAGNSAGVSISVANNGGKLQITPTGGDAAISFVAPVTVDAGGGRLSLSSPVAKYSAQDLQPPVNADRRVEITTSFAESGSNRADGQRAISDVGIASSPTRFDGKIFDDVEFTLQVDGTNVDVALSASSTTTNTSIDDLVADLQGAINSALTAAGFPSDAIVAQALTAEGSSVTGNRIVLESNPAAVSTLSLDVSESLSAGGANGAVTELGFASGEGERKRGKATEFFIQDVTLGGNIGLFENDVAATAAIGFLAVTGEAEATVDPATGKFLEADVNFSLRNPVDEGTRLTITEIADTIKAGQFLFDASEAGIANGAPTTGFVDGKISGGLGLDLVLGPDAGLAAIPGVDSLDATLEIALDSPNWLAARPGFSDPFGIGSDNLELALNGAVALPDFTVASSGVIANDVAFYLSQKFGPSQTDRVEEVVVLEAGDYGDRTGVEAALQTAVDNALTRLSDDLSQAMIAGTVGAVTVAVDGSGGISLTATDTGSFGGDEQLDIRGSVIEVAFTGPDVAGIIDQFKDLSFADIVLGLEAVVDFLQGSESTPGFIQDVLAFELPLIDISIADAVDVAGDFAELIVGLQEDPAGSIQTLETAFREALGLPSGPNILSFNPGTGELDIALSFGLAEELSRPFNLDLADAGLPAELTNLVGLGASGTLDIAAAATFDLLLGLDFTGNDKAFFIRTGEAGTKVSGVIDAVGGDLDFSAQIGPFGIFVEDGEANLNASIDVYLDDDGRATDRFDLVTLDGVSPSINIPSLSDIVVDLPTGAGANSASVNLPLFIGTEDARIPFGTPENAIAASVDLVEFLDGDSDRGFDFDLPTFDFSSLQLPSLFSLLSDPAVIIDGLDRILATVGDGLDTILDADLPFVGDLLGEQPELDFIETFRTDLLQPLGNTIRDNNLNLNGLIGLFQDTLFDVFEPLGLLQDADGVAGITPDDITFDFLDGDGNSTDILTAQALQFDFDIGKQITLSPGTIPFDLGIPALGIEGEIDPTIAFDINLHFGFGVDQALGFYFVADHETEELTADLTIDFGSTAISRAEITGRLLFLALSIEDGLDLDQSGTLDLSPASFDNEFSQLFLSGSIDIVDPNDNDGRLSFPEIIAGPISEIIQPQLTGGAMLRAEATVDFSTIDPNLGSVLPAIQFGLIADFALSASPSEGFVIGAPEVSIADIGLDLGSFISDFAGPILEDIGEVLEPLDWLIGPDGFLNKRIPLLSDLAGSTITGKDLVAQFDPVNGPKVVAFLDFVEEIFFYIDLITAAAAEAEGSSIILEFGDLVVFDDPNTAQYAIIDQEIALSLPSGTDIRKLKNLGGTLPDASSVQPSFSSQPGSKTQRFTSGVTQAGSIEFGLFDPSTIFSLITGQPDVNLVTVELPEFGFEFFYRQVFPIFGPLAGTFSGRLGGGVDLGFGYDTRGLQQFLATDNPLFLGNGFFLNDLDPATGFDRPEAFLNAQIAVGASISILIATAGVEGGIDATVDFNLADIDDDGKVRVDELAANLAANSFNPLSVFDVSGVVEFFLRAFLEINLLFTKITKDYEFARFELFDFDIPFERPGVLASQSGSELTLNIGPNAEGRLKGNISDIAENITVESVSGGVIVYSDQLGISRAVALISPFTGVSTVVADGGLGNDVIDVSGLNSSVTARISGGVGNDTITGGAGADMLSGDEGNDIIVGGAGANVLRGGSGNDDLTGGADADELYGDAGNDTLNGGAGNDTVDGGLGNDNFIRSAGNDTIALSTFGSTEQILGSGLTGGGDIDVLDFSGKAQNLTYFLTDGSLTVGLGQKEGTDGTGIGDFNSTVVVASGALAGITEIIGGDFVDTFYVDGTATDITLDGGKGDDRYIVNLGAGTITATVNDRGNPWDSDNVIRVIGTGGADAITVTNSAIAFGASTIGYVNPGVDGNILQVKVDGAGGDDAITVASTALNVPVRVAGGAGDDTITVGDGTVDNILSFARPGLNKSKSPTIDTTFGLGPVVVDGGAGHDTVIVDETSETSGETVNLTAFTETREAGEVEVGVITGLGMTLQVRDPETDVIASTDGRIEFEGAEIVDLRLGSGADTVTIGGEFDLATGDFVAETLVGSALPVNRLGGITGIVHTIDGSTIVNAGGGDDTINVIDTQTLDRSTLNADLGLFTTSTTDGTGVSNEVQTFTVDASVGYFTLGFRFEETKPLAFDASASAVEQALAELSLIGRDANDTDPLTNPNVSVTRTAVGNGFSYSVEFTGAKGNQNILDQLTPLVTPLILLGDTGVDRLNVDTIRETAFFLGGTGDDFIDLGVDVRTQPVPQDPVSLTAAQVAAGRGVNAQITVDGEEDNDDYEIFLVGGDTDSLINTFDSGAEGFDQLTVYGSDDLVETDLFLLRASTAENGLAFIAKINTDDLSRPNFPIERVNYDVNLEQMIVEARDGDDEFYIDDTRAAITINAGEGNDFFQVGQLYETRRTTALAGVTEADVFATIETTRGFLSNGVSDPMSIFGEGGDDTFIVFHNIATLTLDGGEANDRFVIQAFALAGSQEDLRGQTDLTAGGGADFIQYAVNAPVSINGGDGLDTVIIVGTEFGDDFVVTKDGVFGAGLNVNFTNIEFLEVSGAEGDDRFFIQSTGADFVTRVVGSLGSDFFNVNGPTPGNGVISNDLLGHSGLISHAVSSSFGAISPFDGLSVEGISANVADNDEPAIVITETDGFSRVIQGALSDADGGIDSYAVALARPPRDGRTVTVTVTPPDGIVMLDEGNQRIENADGDAIGLNLVFSDANWYVPQTVRFAVDSQSAAVQDPEFSFGDFGDIQHAVSSNDTITGSVLSASGNTLTASANLFPAPGTENLPEGLRGATVKITNAADPNAADALGESRLILGNTANTLTLSGDWLDDAVPQVNDTLEIQLFSAVQLPSVRVALFTEEIPAIVVDEVDGPVTDSGGETIVGEAAGDAGADIVKVRLSADPGGTVEVALQSMLLGLDGNGDTRVGTKDDGVPQLRYFDLDNGGVEISSLSFDSGNFDSFRTIKVVADDDFVAAVNAGVVEGFHNVDMLFAATQTSGTDIYTGVQTLKVASVGDDDAPGVRIIESDGSTNVIEFDPTLIPIPSQSQTQTGTLFSPNTLVFNFDAALAPTTGGAVLDVTAFGDFDLSSERLTLNIEGQVTSTLFASGGNQYDSALTQTVVIDQATLNTLAADGVITVTATPSGNVNNLFYYSQEYLNLELSFPGSSPASGEALADAAGFPYLDSYQVVLTRQPDMGEVVTVDIAADPTRTTRTGGIVGFAEQVLVSTDGGSTYDIAGSLSFDDSNWNTPQTVYVRAVDAADDLQVDGGDTKVFAERLNQLNNIQGPLFIVGGEGSDLTGLLEREPVMLPGETNNLASLGDVVAGSEGGANNVPPATVTIDADDLDDAAILSLLGVASAADIVPEDLVDLTLEITDGPAKGKVRIVTGVNVIDAVERTWELEIDRLWLSAFTGDAEVPDATSKFTLSDTNPNLLVDEANSVDTLNIDDTDNVNSFDDPALRALLNDPTAENGFAVGRMFFDDQFQVPNGSGFAPLDQLRFTGFGMGADRLVAGVLQPGGITQEELEVVNLELGAGNNRLEVTDATARDDGFQTWTIVNTGAGDDVVSIDLDTGEDGRFAVDTGAGDDSVDATGSTQDLVIFGGDGADILTSGDGSDIVFGDRGRVDFQDGNGKIVTRLGTTPDQVIGSVSAAASDATLTDATASFPLDDLSLAGLVVGINEGAGVGQFRVITDNTATTLTLDAPWDTPIDATSKYIIFTLPDLQTDGVARGATYVQTIDPDVGGSDIIDGAGGDDLVFGGLGGDIIDAFGSGVEADIILGDHGEATFENGVPVLIETTEPDLGGSDTIAGGPGSNIIIGGAGADSITAGGDDQPDIILGDNGAVTFDNGVRQSVQTSAPGVGGADFIVAGDGQNVLFGGTDSDDILGGNGDDIAIGDNGIALFDAAGVLSSISTSDVSDGANDTINVGAGRNVVLGGVADDTILAGAGNDVVLGDNGEATFDAAGALVRIQTPNPGEGEEVGAADIIGVGDGRNVVLGGVGGDDIASGVGDDVILGDNGEATFFANGELENIATRDEGTVAAPGIGGADVIQASSGRNIVLGGVAGDEITTTGGDDVVVGDNGEATFRNTGILQSITTPAAGGGEDDGGVDLIDVGDGRNVILGGVAGDLIASGLGADVILGDNGEALFTAAGILTFIQTRDPMIGGNDMIVSANGSDIVLGGFADDTILAGGDDDARDIVLGDNGLIDFTDLGDLIQVASTAPAKGGDDRITVGNGPDVSFGGVGDDVILAATAGDESDLLAVIALLQAGTYAAIAPGDAATDILLGDNGVANFNGTSNLLDVSSSDPGEGGMDTLVGGNGGDLIFGGSEADIIVAGVAANVDDNAEDTVFGDNARATFQRSETFDPGEEVAVLSFNFNASDYHRTVTGVAGAVTIDGSQVGNWNNLKGDGPTLWGDDADEIIVFDDGSIAPGVTIEWAENLDSHPRSLSDVTHGQIWPGDDQDLRLFEGYLKTGRSDTVGVDIAGLSAHFASSDIYVYLDADDGDSRSGESVRRISDGTTAYYLDDPDGNTFTGTYVEVTSEDPGLPQVGNYVVFRGVTSDEVSIRIDDADGSHHTDPAITGIQVVGTSLPIDRVESLFPGFGGADTIITGGGQDLAVGGDGVDTIQTFGPTVRGMADADLVVGDHARGTIKLDELRTLETIFPGVGDGDVILTGNGEDIVLGGTGGDEIGSGIEQPYDNGTVSVLSLNFNSDIAKGAITGVAGVVQVDNWNNLSAGHPDGGHYFWDWFSPSTDADDTLVLNDGSAAAGVSVEWGEDLDSSWWTDRAHEDAHGQIDEPDTENARLFEGSIETGTGKTLGVDVTGLQGEFAGGYDVYVYIDADDDSSRSGSSVRKITDGTTTFFLDDPDGNTFAGEFVEVTSTSAASAGIGNYVVFRDVTTDTFSLRIDDDGYSSSNRPSIAGMQIVGGPDKDGVVDLSTAAKGGDFDTDAIVGDNGAAFFFEGRLYEIRSTDPTYGGSDVIRAGADGDLIIGGSNLDPTAGGSDLDDIVGDRIHGEAGDDLIVADNARLLLSQGQIIGLGASGASGDWDDWGHWSDHPYDVLGVQLGDDTIGDNDVLEGGRDNDLLYGQFGNDTAVFAGSGLGRDLFVEAGHLDSGPNDPHDRLDFAMFAGPVDVDLDKTHEQTINGGSTFGDVNLRLRLVSHESVEDVTGSEFDDDIAGNDRNNTLIGLGGRDDLYGEDGDDLLIGGDGDDDLYGGRDDDLLDGGAGDDDLYGDGSYGRDIILGGAGDDYVNAGGGDDLVDGEAGNDYIRGSSGDDTLLGGDGNDHVRGDSGSDVIEGGPGYDSVFGGGGWDSVEQDVGSTPLNLGALFSSFDAKFGREGFIYVDPNNPADDRPPRLWLEPFLESVPGNGAMNLLAATEGTHFDGPALSSGDLDDIVEEAARRLDAQLGLSAAQRAVIEHATFEIADLPGLALAQADHGRIVLDRDAAGHGWFIDPTPRDDSEFADDGSGTMAAHAGSEAAARMDLLTAVTHELGHLLGLGHHEVGPAGAFMAETLASGERAVSETAAALYDPGTGEFLDAEEGAYFTKMDDGLFSGEGSDDDGSVFIDDGLFADDEDSSALDWGRYDGSAART